MGADYVTPFGGLDDAESVFSRTSLDKLRDACARFGCRLAVPLAEGTAGVEVPLVERPSLSCMAGVAVPLSPRGVAIAEASLREASPRMALTFLLRRWLGRQCGLRKLLWMEWMSSSSISAWCAACAARASGLDIAQFEIGGGGGVLRDCWRLEVQLGRREAGG